MAHDLLYDKTVFPSGTRLILVPMEGIESVATAVMVNVGSRMETPEINGASHFLEHMVFKGTKKYPTMEDVIFIERMGGMQNAYTDIDITNYHNKVMTTDWKEALDINTELALHPLLKEEFINKERDVILEEVKKYEDEPAIKVNEVFHEMMYPDTKLGMRVIGTEKSLRASSSTTLREHHDRWYTPDRMVVVMAGKLDRGQTSEIRAQIEESFKKSINGHVQSETVSDIQNEPKLSVVTKPDASQAHLVLGIRTFPRNSDDRFAWTVFNLLFGLGFTSRLFKQIREKRGLCYTVRSSSDGWDDVGYWSIYAGVATEKVPEAVSAIIDEFEKALDRGVTEEEVKVAQKRLITMLSFKSEDPEFMAEFYGKQELYHIPILTIPEYFRKIKKVCKDEIDRMLRKYIVQKRLNLALVWNKPIDNNLLKLLSI